MTALNWKFVKVSADRGGIMFMLCYGDSLMIEFSQLMTKKVKGYPVTTGTTSSPFESAMITEGWLEKSGVKLTGPTISDYARSVNYGHQVGFENVQKPTVTVEIIDIFKWK